MRVLLFFWEIILARRLLNLLTMDEIATYPPKEICRLPLQEYYERSNVLLRQRDGWLQPIRFHSVRDEVRLLETGSALVDFSGHGLLRLDGSDAADFLNRISSNDFRKFLPGDSVQTVLTTEKGRVVDSVVALHMSDHILLIASPNAQLSVMQWIEKFIIAEDLRVNDETGRHIIFAVIHPDDFLEKLGVRVFRSNYYDVDALFSISDADVSFPDHLSPYMDAQVGYDAFELFKIRRGIPQYSREIMAECNPLELNFRTQISFTKGCYIGQEVVARLDTYKKIQRTLCSFRGDGRLVHSGGGPIACDGKDIGIITNVAHDANDDGSFAGLGVVRKEFARLHAQYVSGESAVPIIIDRVFNQEDNMHGNNSGTR